MAAVQASTQRSQSLGVGCSGGKLNRDCRIGLLPHTMSELIDLPSNVVMSERKSMLSRHLHRFIDAMTDGVGRCGRRKSMMDVSPSRCSEREAYRILMSTWKCSFVSQNIWSSRLVTDETT